MKRVVVYFSDIMGTIMGSKQNTNEDYLQFKDLLHKIKENEQADDMIFSLISTDNKDVVSNMHSTLSPFLNETVTYGRQFFDDGYYTESEVFPKKYSGKPKDIMEYIGELSQNYEIISVYYVDDVAMYHKLLSFLAEKSNCGQLIHSIIPTEKLGISEVNRLLENCVKKEIGPQR